MDCFIFVVGFEFNLHFFLIQIEAGKKRNIDSAKKTTVPVKKTKFVTPQKTGQLAQVPPPPSKLCFLCEICFYK